MIVELKQWTEVGRSNITDCVTVDYGGRPRDTLHPSRQVAQYQRYLLDTHPAFSDDRAIALDACAYLHYAQHDPTSPLYHADFATLLGDEPVVRRRPVDALATFLDQRVAGPDEGEILERVAATAFKPHKRLLDHVARVIRNEPTFVLLDEQLVAYNAILDAVGDAGQNQQNVVFLIEGGPGTGKSVIALNLVAELAERGLSTLHLTGSKAFTENLRKIVGGRAGALFKYFRDTATVTDKLDVAILDEAHRIRTISTSRFTPAKARTGKSQIDDILDSSRVTVFFIDDLQVVRPGEVGSTDLIREAAAKRSIEVRDFKLEAQFRSNGSDSFIQWVDNTLELDRTPQVLWSMDDEFDFQIVGSIGQLEQKIRAKAAERDDRSTRRRLLLALVRPRRRRPARAGRQGRGVVDALERQGRRRPARRPASRSRTSGRAPKEGIDQVGCVYTAQGFEFDYVGVIVGPDLVYRPMDGGWVGQRDQSHDRVVRRGVTEAEFTRYVKSTYRVLLTRGLRGCYV